MNKNPVIGVTAYQGVQAQGYPAVILLQAYIQAILSSGGAPVILSPELSETAWRSIYSRVDGILFSGGGDIGVRNYRGDDDPNVRDMNESRDSLEINLMRVASRDGKPLLGICRGCQVMNVALGGTLYTHLDSSKPDFIKHDYYPDIPRNYLAHTIDVKIDSNIHQIVDASQLQVNSLHHQGLRQIAPSLVATAFASDGLVETIELQEHPYAIGVQWHPEWLMDQPAMQRLFRSFVDAAARV